MKSRKSTCTLGVETLDARALPSSMFVSDVILLPNKANQEIIIAAAGDTMVRGINLRVEMGDGRGANAEPKITGVTFNDAIWADHARSIEGGAIEDEPQFAQASMVLVDRDVSVKASGIVARLQVDTTGFQSGTFDVKIKDTLFGLPSDFAGLPASPVNNGSIKIASPGDATLNGVFNVEDLISVFQAGEYQDNVEGNSTWAEGDWDQNGDFETGDLILAFQVGAYVRE